MQPTVTLSNEQAASIAAVIMPMIRGYVDSHKAEYKQFLKEWNAKKLGGVITHENREHPAGT